MQFITINILNSLSNLGFQKMTYEILFSNHY